MKTLLLTAAVGAMMTMAAGAMAQAPGGGPPRGGPGAGGPGMGGGMGMPANDRAGTIQRFGLNDPALKLTAAQTAEIDKAADAYVAEVAKVPAGAGGPPSQEAMAARTKARDNLTAAVNKVLNADQKKTWEAAQAAQAQRRGGMGGPGGGMGGPPGGGPPGGRPPGQ
ncbi:MAG TPA: hypothetical protein VNQ32_10530 [Steroidobacteraceae bacterium]|nr:hypothetical protein [Steroidobacteraceae bacterium]